MSDFEEIIEIKKIITDVEIYTEYSAAFEIERFYDKHTEEVVYRSYLLLGSNIHATEHTTLEGIKKRFKKCLLDDYLVRPRKPMGAIWNILKSNKEDIEFIPEVVEGYAMAGDEKYVLECQLHPGNTNYHTCLSCHIIHNKKQ